MPKTSRISAISRGAIGAEPETTCLTLEVSRGFSRCASSIDTRNAGGTYAQVTRCLDVRSSSSSMSRPASCITQVARSSSGM